jgi:uncharacterized repeat protein (TIGR03803 family)
MQSGKPVLLAIIFLMIVLALLSAATAASAQTFTLLHSFDSTDGFFPESAMVQATNGALYGTTSSGGAGSVGTVFRITLNGTLTTLHSFDSTDGASATGGLVTASNGNLYGTTGGGGAHGNGTVFEITPSGTLTTLYSFCSQISCNDGTGPAAAMVQAPNGNLYGTTGAGGVNGHGTVFTITTGGTLTTLHNFCLETNCPDGDEPNGLIQGADGNFYGTTQYGGANGDGTVFKITTSGTLTTLHSFNDVTDGAFPLAGLVQAANGILYGTTYEGSPNGNGTVFSITTTGTLTTLYSFCSLSGCSDGGLLTAPLIQATNGNLYGATEGGGSADYGTVFEMTPGGALTTLHSFDSSDGQGPRGGLVQETNGTLYGTTGLGGANDDGTIFSLSVGLHPFVETLTTSGKVGASVKILGNNLTGATSVAFNGTAATFSVASSSEITATVPTGATTGFITVTTAGGTLKSNRKFRVTP